MNIKFFTSEIPRAFFYRLHEKKNQEKSTSEIESLISNHLTKTASNQPRYQVVTVADLYKIAFLGDIADIVAKIDSDKNKGGGNIISLTNKAMNIINAMKSESLETGALDELFTILKDIKDNPELIYKAIDDTHCEIERLLGDKAWHIYWPD